MANSDDAVFMTNMQNPAEMLHKEIRILAMHMREAFNLPNAEDSSLTQQTLPTGTNPITYTP